ncbi:hypothetical protein BDY24DRAFT_375058 [Mrakia frigida]|uniref:Ipi1p n=1 Tax=Mrakia frigida TaxID=29902 RepID=UPI003FCBFDE7
MPKSSKQKRDKVQDFSKSKVKLGKGKQVAVNSTDTSYKARSIVLPTQTISVDKDSSIPTTKRNLSFEDLVVQSKHYNAGIRKDSLIGLKELLTEHPHLRTKELTSIVSIIVKCLPDEDPHVRSTLHIFTSFLLPTLPLATLTPHLPLLLLHTSSALCHIFPEIRIDAVKILGVIMTVCPKECVDGWGVEGGRGMGVRVGEGLMGVLGLGGGPSSSSQNTSSSSTLRPAAKLIILRTLSHFLSTSLSPTITSPTWFLAPSFSTSASYAEFETLLKGKKPYVAPMDDWLLSGGGGGWELGDFGLGGTSAGAKAGEADEGGNGGGRLGREAAKLYLTLHPLLVSTFLDTAPTAFSPSGSATSVSHADVNLELVAVVGELLGTLGRTVLRDTSEIPKPMFASVKTSLRNLLGHMAVYFPFNSSTFQRRDVKSEALLLSLSLSFSSLVAQVSLTQAHLPPRTKSSNPQERAKALEDCYAKMRKGMANGGEKKLVEQVAEWVAGLLRGENITSSNPLGQPLPPQTYISLLPTVWSLLNQPPPAPVPKSKPLSASAATLGPPPPEPEVSVPHTVAGALLDHLNRVGSDSAVKKIGVEFVGRLGLLETLPLYTGPFRLASPSPLASLKPKLDKFYQSLPKMLWELGSKDLAASETVFHLLHHLLLTSPTVHTSLILPSLSPYFHLHHASRGELPGPWTKVGSQKVRRLALDVAWLSIRAAGGDEAGEKLSEAVGKAVEGERGGEEKVYWEELTRLS